MIIDQIYRYISATGKTINESMCKEIGEMSSHVFKRQFMTDDGETKLRMSSVGKCIRQLAYIHHKEPQDGKTIDSRAKLIFWAGDLTEMTIVGLAKSAGCTLFATGKDQITLSLKIGETELQGHPDGIFLYNGELHLLEVKSMSSFSFKRFEAGDVDTSYIMQMNFYMKHLGLDKCVLVAHNKDNGLLGEKLIEFDQKLYTAGLEKLKEVVSTTPETLPDRPYEQDAKGFYPWMCAYCSWYNTCLVKPGLAKRVVVGSSYKLKATKEEIKHE